MLDNNYYVYVYLDPRKPGKYVYGEKYEFEYEPFYVGKGKLDRCKAHLYNCSLNGPNPLKNNKIKKIRKDINKDPIIILYDKDIIEKEALKLENKMITIIGRINLNSGPLTNLTDGGEKGVHRIITEEMKKNISESNKKAWNNLTKEEKENRSKKTSEVVKTQYAEMNDEEKNWRILRQKDGWKNMSQEDRKKWWKNCKKTYTVERRKQISDNSKKYGLWTNGRNPQQLNPRMGLDIGNHKYVYAVYDLKGKLIEKNYSPKTLAIKYKVALVTMVKFSRFDGCYRGYYWRRFPKEMINNIVEQILDVKELERMKRYKQRKFD